MPKRRTRMLENFRDAGSASRECSFAIAAIVLTAVLCAAPAGLRGQAPAVDAVVAKAEPGIACVLVSRSEMYRTLGHVKADDAPGKLGGFDFLSIPDAKLGIFNLSIQDTLKERLRLRSKLDLAYVQHVPESYGSGIVVDSQGLVLTNYHVVQDAAKVYVRLPGGKGSYADIWAADPRSDLAVLKLLDERVRPLTTIPLGNADGLRRGQPVIALANPFAVGVHDGQPSVSTGVVSNLRRRVPGRVQQTEANANPLYQFGILIQTDVRIALGSSGGALLNPQGECVGITTSLAAVAGGDAPGGFALPVNSAIRKVVEILKKGQEVEYGFLGVAVHDGPLPEGGAVVSHVQEGSPAKLDADLQSGDVIVAIGPHPVRDTQDLMLGLGLYFAGEKASLSIIRGGGPEQKVDVTLAKYNVLGKTIASSLGNRPYVGGLRVEYTSILVQKPNTAHQIPKGVLVTDVQPDSRAARASLVRDDDNSRFAGLVKDDIITHVAGVLVTTPPTFYEQVARHKGPIDLTVRRGDQVQRIRW